jgi:hypothetical protein
MKKKKVQVYCSMSFLIKYPWDESFKECEKSRLWTDFQTSKLKSDLQKIQTFEYRTWQTQFLI